RALFVLLAADCAALARRASADRFRRRRARDARWLAADLRASLGGWQPTSNSARVRRRRSRTPGWNGRARLLCRLPRQGCAPQASVAQLSDWGQGKWPIRCRLRRARKRQHSLELLRHPHGSARLYGRLESLQAGAVSTRDADSYFSPRPNSRN